MRIGIMGAGYVGLVTGACFAKLGHHVTVFDVDSQKIIKLQMGECPIYEPGLEEIIKSKRMHFCDLVCGVESKEPALGKCDVIFICVGTPSKPGSEEPELRYVWDAAHIIGGNAAAGAVVVVKSTVPPGTTRKVDQILRGYTSHIFTASNPEFLREGSAISDFMRPDRVVIGSESALAASTLCELYKDVVRIPSQIIEMTKPESAEMTKLAANGMLATRISYMNEIAGLCEKLGADVTEVRHGVGSDSRIGSAFLYAGPGYGGSCFPKDVRALTYLCESGFNIFNAVDFANWSAKERIHKKILSALHNEMKDKKIVVWGLAFKPDTDDVRESASLHVIDSALKMGAQIVVVDPQADLPLDLVERGAAQDHSSMYLPTCGADLLVLMTEWREFRKPDFEQLANNMKGRVIIDARNVLDREDAMRYGFTVIGVGR